VNGKECQFVAYVYPGWHASGYRHGFNEWALLDRFQPYFPEHVAPPAPLGGRYDDSNPVTAQRQVACAAEYGLSAFSYFAYYGSNGFVMQEPADTALDVAPDHFKIALTLCLRLPHQQLPLPRDFLHWRSAGARSPINGTFEVERPNSELSVANEITLAELGRLVGVERARRLPLTTLRRLVGRGDALTAASAPGRASSVARVSDDVDSASLNSTASKCLQRLEPLTLKEFAVLFECWARRCRTRDAYWTIDGRPVCAFLNIGDYALVYGVEGFALMLETGRAVFKAVLGVEPFVVGVIGQASVDGCKLAARLPLDAITGYGLLPQWKGPPVQDYESLIVNRIREWHMMQARLPIPFIPVVCAGWDASVRGEWIGDLNNAQGFPWRPVVTGVSCEAFGRFVDAALDFNRTHHRHANVVFVHAWNEWTEASAIEPSDRFGYGFLRQIQMRAGCSRLASTHKNIGGTEHVGR
jgi:hypothetical protein